MQHTRHHSTTHTCPNATTRSDLRAPFPYPSGWLLVDGCNRHLPAFVHDIVLTGLRSRLTPVYCSARIAAHYGAAFAVTLILPHTPLCWRRLLRFDAMGRHSPFYHHRCVVMDTTTGPYPHPPAHAALLRFDRIHGIIHPLFAVATYDRWRSFLVCWPLHLPAPFRFEHVSSARTTVNYLFSSLDSVHSLMSDISNSVRNYSPSTIWEEDTYFVQHFHHFS